MIFLTEGQEYGQKQSEAIKKLNPTTGIEVLLSPILTEMKLF
jgi:hypothetical protein